MPMNVKPWAPYPPNTTTPQNAAALQAMEARIGNYVGAEMQIGPGVAGYNDFVVAQHGGGDMTAIVGVVGQIMGAYIALDTNGGIERYEYNGAQLSATFTPADASNPRIDRVVLTPSSVVTPTNPLAWDTQIPIVRVLAGTPTGGATLDNLTGAQAVPTGSLLLADVVVGAGVTSILTANIRDRRGPALPGVSGWPAGITTLDAVTAVFHPSMLIAELDCNPGQNNFQNVAMIYLPRRIIGATRLRWRYTQSGTTLLGNYNIGIYDPSGRKLVETSSQGFVNSATSIQNRSEVIPTTSFEAGMYYAAIGFSVLSSGDAFFMGASIRATAGSFVNGSGPGVMFGFGSGGTTLPTTIAGFTDFGVTAGAVAQLGVPAFSLSVS